MRGEPRSISSSSIHLAFAHSRVGFADCRGAPLRQDALGRRGEVERRPVGLGAVVKRLQWSSPIVEPGGCGPLVFIVIAEHASVPDDPERLRESEEAVEGVRATTEDQVLLEEGGRERGYSLISGHAIDVGHFPISARFCPALIASLSVRPSRDLLDFSDMYVEK